MVLVTYSHQLLFLNDSQWFKGILEETCIVFEVPLMT